MLKIIEQLAKNTNIYENKTNMSVIRLQMKLYIKMGANSECERPCPHLRSYIIGEYTILIM
jgi:hypothetical protein